MERPPSVDALARELAGTGLPHPLLVDVARAAIAAGDPASAPARAAELERTLLRRVVNATRVGDYGKAFAEHPSTAVVLKVHQSNYRIVGFTESVAVKDLAALGPPVVADLGSGLLDAACPWLGGPPEWLVHEPAVRQTLAA